MAPARRRHMSSQHERYSSAVSSGGDNAPSNGRLHTGEDVDVMQMAHKLVEFVTTFSPSSVSPSLLTHASDHKAS